MNDQTSAIVSKPQRRFDAYQIRPVVETTAPNEIEKGYEAFLTLIEAENEVASFRNNGALQAPTILWSLYGLRDGIAEHLADRISEAEAFALLYAISGISGASGQTHYPVPHLWSILHFHRHGTDVWVASAHDEPTGAQVVRCLEIDFEPRRSESIEIHAVGEITPLDWQDGDDCPLPDEDTANGQGAPPPRSGVRVQ